MLMTAKGQTILELSEEFIKALKETQSGSPDMDAMFDAIVMKEQTDPYDPMVIAAIQNVCNTPYNAFDSKLLINTQLRVSPTLLSWICMQSSSIPEYIDTMLGMFAVVFYSSNPKKSEMTLNWVGYKVGKGKLVGFRQFIPWMMAARCEDGENIFYKLTPEELYGSNK